MSNLLYLTCFECGEKYEKPETFKEWSEDGQAAEFYFKRCLKYCDECRRNIEKEMIKSLPNVIEALAKKIKTDKESTTDEFST